MGIWVTVRDIHSGGVPIQSADKEFCGATNLSLTNVVTFQLAPVPSTAYTRIREMPTIQQNIKALQAELPPWVTLVAVVKQRTPAEIQQALETGICVIGENYVQEALQVTGLVRGRAQMHFIGHLQRNKAHQAVKIFDMIETVDSLPLAQEIDRRCAEIGKIMPVLIEINSAREQQKKGVLPEQAEEFVSLLACLNNIKVMGVMTIGPYSTNSEDSRPAFVVTSRIYQRLRDRAIPGTEIKYLSMGMSTSYSVAIEEGANIVRIGTKIFGPRGGE